MAILGQTILLEKIARVSLVFVDVKIWLKKKKRESKQLFVYGGKKRHILEVLLPKYLEFF